MSQTNVDEHVLALNRITASGKGGGVPVDAPAGAVFIGSCDIG